MTPQGKKKSVGFIGLGNMGQPMALRLAEAGYRMTVRDLRPEAEAPLIKKGARSGKSPKQTVGDITISLLASPAQVKEVYLGKDGLVEGISGPGNIVVEGSAIDPDTTTLVEKAVKDRGGRFLSCTFNAAGSPSVIIPRGLLGVIVGGEKACIEESLDIFKTLGQTVICVPDVLMPGLLKIGIKMLSPIHTIANLEVALFLMKCGIDPIWLIRLMDAMGRSDDSSELKRLMAGGLSLGGDVRLSHKDLLLAMQVATEKDLPLPLTSCAQQILLACKGAGFIGKSTPVSLLGLSEKVLGKVLPSSQEVDLKEILPPSHPVKVVWL